MSRDNKIQLISWIIFIPLAFLIVWIGIPLFRYLDSKFILLGSTLINSLMGAITFLIIIIIVSKFIKR